MVQLTTTSRVDAIRFGMWLELNGGELVGCDRNSRKGEFMYIVRLGALGLEVIARKIEEFM